MPFAAVVLHRVHVVSPRQERSDSLVMVPRDVDHLTGVCLGESGISHHSKTSMPSHSVEWCHLANLAESPELLTISSNCRRMAP